jgi:hypothetical protein
MLAITTDSHKFPPFVIFRREALQKYKFLPEIILRVQERRWMTEELILKWLNVEWKRWAGAWLHKCDMFVLNTFCEHIIDMVKVKVNEDSDIAVIPGGITKVLQPLDDVINWPFYVTFQRLYDHWVTTRKQELTSSGRLKHAPLQTVCDWILAAQHSVSP